MGRITIKDIAKMAGVSISTVSRALKDHPDISIPVKDKIKLIAQNLNFVPNASAVGLRQKSIRTIGLILPSIHNFFVPSMIEGVSKALKSNHYKLMILTSDEDYEKEVQNIATCIDSNVDGILISLTKSTINLHHLQKPSELNIPIVLLDKSIHQEEYSEVMINDYLAGKMCFEYLQKQDAQYILGFFGPKTLNITLDRLNGFMEATTLYPDIFTQFYFCESSLDAKNTCVAALRDFPKTDAIFMMSDEVMVGINAAINDEEWKHINHKIKTIAISEGYLPQFMYPPITHLLHNGTALGQNAAELLLDQINSPNKKPIKKLLNISLQAF